MRPARKPIAFSQRLFFASFASGKLVRWGSTHLLGSCEPLGASLRTSGTIAPPVKQGGDRGASGFFGGPEGRNRREAPQRVYITGMFIALGAILMFFAALVSAWVVRRGLGNTDWQPIVLPRVVWLNTLILVASSLTIAHSRHCLVVNRDPEHRHWWGVTAILGMLFLTGQLLAWRQLLAAGLFLASSPSSSFFYVLTAAHGLHILGGVAALLLLTLHAPCRVTRDTATRVIALYWHFLGALWVSIFALLWWEGSK